MRHRALALVAALAAILAYFSPGPPEVARPSTPGRSGAPARALAPAAAEATPGDRDPFAFGGSIATLREQLPLQEEPEPLAPLVVATPTPPPLRLVGLVAREGRLHAALTQDGEVVLAVAGGQAFGFTVVEIDAVGGVLLRGADGLELRLPIVR